MRLLTTFGAETYNCAAYGQYAYNQCGPQNQNTNGGLAYTGEALALPLALGGAVLIASAILLVKRLRRRLSKNSI